MKREIIVICGPTAVGKTKYAIETALHIGGEVVSCDSMQLYKYMDIGSAKPTAEERSRVKHYLVDESILLRLFPPPNIKNWQKCY